MALKLPKTGKKLPKFKSGEEMSDFVMNNDMSPYINQRNFVPAHEVFEYAPKNTSMTMRWPEILVKKVKAIAAKKNMPYQRYIRAAVEEKIGREAR